MMVVHLISPDKSRDTLFISNYATLEIKDTLTRVDGVGSITVFGSRDYAMRIWLDPAPPAVARPDRRRRHAGAAGAERPGRRRRAQSAAGREPGAFQVAVKTLGRLADPEEFANIVVKQTRDRRGAPARTWPRSSLRRWIIRRIPTSNVEPAVALAVFQRPGSNALSTAQTIRATMEQLSKRFPPGIQYTIIYDPTQFIQQSVDEVQKTIGEAILLVVLVVILFSADLARRDHPARRHPGLADRHVLLHGDVRLHAQQSFAVRAGAWRSASWSTTPSWWWRTSSATSRPAWRRARPRSRAWTRSARR